MLSARPTSRATPSSNAKYVPKCGRTCCSFCSFSSSLPSSSSSSSSKPLSHSQNYSRIFDLSSLCPLRLYQNNVLAYSDVDSSGRPLTQLAIRGILLYSEIRRSHWGHQVHLLPRLSHWQLRGHQALLHLPHHLLHPPFSPHRRLLSLLVLSFQGYPSNQGQQEHCHYPHHSFPNPPRHHLHHLPGLLLSQYQP